MTLRIDSVEIENTTLGETIETDGSNLVVSAAKATAYNKAFGTSAGEVLEGDNDALYVKLAGAQTITGEKTYSASKFIVSNAAFQLASAGNVNFMRDSAGKAKITLTANGSFVSELQMIYGNDANANNLITQTATSVQHTYGTSVANIFYNVNNQDTDHIFRGDTDDNLLRTDGGNNNVGMGVAAPDASAKLDITSTTSGFLAPRMTEAQRDLIGTPATGLFIYNTDTDEFNYYDGTSWLAIAAATSSAEYGEMYFSTPVETVISTINTAVRALGTTTAGELSGFTMSANNTLRYDGATTKVFEVNVSFSMTAASNNKLISLYVSKNGTELAKSRTQRQLSTGSDVGAGATSCLVSLATNDTVGLFIENNTDAVNATIEFANVSVLTA